MSKISVKNLDLYYGDFKALKNVNLEIESNKITAFIGPSGCGKSTLLKSLNRMNDLVEGCKIDGQILLDGEDIYGRMDVNLYINSRIKRVRFLDDGIKKTDSFLSYSNCTFGIAVSASSFFSSTFVSSFLKTILPTNPASVPPATANARAPST